MSVTLLARRLLPEPVRAPLRGVMHSARAYSRARRVLARYSRHYAAVHLAYRRAHPGASGGPRAIAALGVLTIPPDAPPDALPLPPAPPALVERLGRDVAERLSWTAQCRFFPPTTDAALPLPPRSDAVDAVRRGETIALQLIDVRGLDGLEEFCAAVVPVIEERMYGAHVLVDKVYVYRSPVSRQQPQASWVWHYDEHPREVLKLMLYLTDVTGDTAPFMFLARGGDGRAVIGTRTPLYGQSRMSPARMARFQASGCVARAVTGPRGTLVLFNDNVIHRATLATRAHRDVLVLQLRPTDRPRRPLADPRWTGSFQNLDFNRDPAVVEPQPWPGGR